MDGFAAIFPMENTRLQALDKSRLYIGTSSFGFGGTNAHAIFERAGESVIEDLPSVKDLFAREAFLWRRPHHPMIHAHEDGSEAPVIEYLCELRGRMLALVNDHQVRGSVVVPGTAYMEMALASGVEIGLGSSGSEGSGAVLLDLILYEFLMARKEQEEEARRV